MRTKSIGWLLSVVVVTAAQARSQGEGWRMLADPAAVGWNAEGLAAARKAAEQAGSAAVMAVQGDHVVIAWGDVERRFKCHSVRKSVLSALYGIAVGRDLIDPNATLAALGIDDLSPLSDGEKTAKVRDLLAARSGVYHPAAKEPRDMKRSRPARGSSLPGERFHYNNWDFNVLGVIFNEQTKVDLFDAFGSWLAEPCGMQDWRRQDGRYELEPGNSRHPAYAFRLSTRDLARFGVLFARNGAGVVPQQWVQDSTRIKSRFANGAGYGDMWWVHPAGGLPKFPALNERDLFMARGTGGQVVMVVPSAEFVFVHRGDTDNDRRVRGGDVWRIAEAVFAARPAEAPSKPLLTELQATPLPGARPAPESPKALPMAVDKLPDFVGAFALPRLGKATIFVHRERLFARREGGFEAELFRCGDDEFFMRTNGMRLQFVRGQDGACEAVEATFRGRKIRGRRVE